VARAGCRRVSWANEGRGGGRRPVRLRVFGPLVHSARGQFAEILAGLDIGNRLPLAFRRFDENPHAAGFDVVQPHCLVARPEVIPLEVELYNAAVRRQVRAHPLDLVSVN